MREFQEKTRLMAVYHDSVIEGTDRIEYCILGINDEAGEVAGALKKYMRGDYGEEEMVRRVRKEAGDVLWYVARLFDELKLDMDSEAWQLITHLLRRQEEGKLRGDGSDR